MGRVMGFWSQGVAEGQASDDDLDVDDEHRPPREVLEQRAAADRPEPQAEGRDPGPSLAGLRRSAQAIREAVRAVGLA